MDYKCIICESMKRSPTCFWREISFPIFEALKFPLAPARHHITQSIFVEDIWLVVEFQTIWKICASQNGNLPQIGVETTKNMSRFSSGEKYGLFENKT